MALHLWVLSPLVPSDASTIVETLSRSMEAAMSQFRALGKSLPKQTLIWAPCLFRKAVFVYVSAIDRSQGCDAIWINLVSTWSHLRLIIACARIRTIQS